MDSKLILYYIVSILSIVLYVSSVQFKSKKNILITQFFSSICYSIVYALVNAWSGFSIQVIKAIKDFTFFKFEKKNKKIPLVLLIIFIISIIDVSIIFYSGILSLLPLLTNVLLFISTYFKNPKYIRWVTLICGILFAVYNVYVGAYIVLIGNALEIISALISIIKYRKTDNNFK